MWSKNKSGVAETQTGPYHPLKEKKKAQKKGKRKKRWKKNKAVPLGEGDRGDGQRSGQASYPALMHIQWNGPAEGITRCFPLSPLSLHAKTLPETETRNVHEVNHRKEGITRRKRKRPIQMSFGQKKSKNVASPLRASPAGTSGAKLPTFSTCVFFLKCLLVAFTGLAHASLLLTGLQRGTRELHHDLSLRWSVG